MAKVTVIRNGDVKEIDAKLLKNTVDKEGNITSYGFIDAGWKKVQAEEPAKEGE